MKHIEPTTAYSEVARRVTERAQRMMEPRRVIIPVAGEPDPDRIAYSNHLLEEINAKRETPTGTLRRRHQGGRCLDTKTNPS